MLIQERLLQVLDYNPETGVFTRRLKQMGTAQGKISGSITSHGYLVTFKTIEEAEAAYIAEKRVLHSSCTI